VILIRYQAVGQDSAERTQRGKLFSPSGLHIPVDDVSVIALTPGAVLAQFWGDVDRPSVEAAGLLPWPPVEPKPGHMGVLLSQIGPDPIVRFQTGGLKAAEAVMRGGMTGGEGFAQVV
jgi:hypothetical protein